MQIGGLAIQGPEAFQAQFAPTFQTHLTQVFKQSLGLEFQAVALDFDQNFESVRTRDVDFIFSNPAAYTCLAVEFELRTLASLLNFRRGHALDRFAGVIFTRHDSAFHNIEDLRQARVEAVSISGLGAMQLQQAELLANGLNIMTDVKRLTFAYNQNKIVRDVESGYADVGFVRTDMIDRSEAANKTSWKNFRVINQVPDASFPFARSTSFTPEWPIGALTHVPNEIMELVGEALMALSRDDSKPELAQPALKGHFASWVPPMNYYKLMEILQSIGYFDPTLRKCLRNADVYKAISCPKGFVKQSETKAFCSSDCQPGYTCLCNPCSKLREPELVLRPRLLNTSWEGAVDCETVSNRSFVSESCKRMSSCGRFFVGQKLRWSLLDQIGTDSRLAINAKLISSVQIRLTADGPWQEMRPENTTLDGFVTQEYVYEDVAVGSGTHVVQVHVNHEQADMSPVVVHLENPPQKSIDCPAGHQLEDNGQCRPCKPGTVSLGGKAGCRPCEPGTKQALAAQQYCEACPAGTAQARFAAVECNNCTPGTSTRGKTGFQQCDPCEPGQEAPDYGFERCRNCDRGFYSEAEGTASCSACIGGKTTLNIGASSEEQCTCRPGDFLRSASSKLSQNASSQQRDICMACQEGLSCPGENHPPQQLPGRWAEGPDADTGFYSVILCRNRLECPGGEIGTCAFGRIGRACNNCQDWFRKGSRGECKACDGLRIIPAIVAILLSCSFGVLLYILFTRASSVTQRLDQISVLLTAGQVIMMFQTFSAMQHIKIDWTEPAMTIINHLSVFSLNLDFLNLGCVVAQDAPLLRMCIQLFAYPVFLLGVSLTFLISRLLRRSLQASMLFNMNGYCVLILYMSLTIVALLPFQCVLNPNGEYTMVSDPGLTCWHSDQHGLMVSIAILGILIYPVSFLTVCIRATIMYPSYIRSGQGLLLVSKYKFLFQRFRPSNYYYGVIYLFRNTFLALIPVIGVSQPSIQIVSMAAVLLLSMTMQIRVWPWRTEAANVADMCFAPAFIIFLVSAAPMIDPRFQGNHSAGNRAPGRLCSALLCASIVLMMLTLSALAVRWCSRILQSSLRYQVFLCHQKSAAGSFARFVKIIMDKHSPDQVFLDSDQLHDLDQLFDQVRSQTRHLVVLLTQDLMTRVWCCGEIVTAYSNRVSIVPVSCNGCTVPDSGSLDAIIDSWTEQEQQTLLNFGITMELTKRACMAFHDLPMLRMSTFASLEDQEKNVLQLVSHCKLTRRPFMETSSPTQSAEILILGQTSESEPYAACMVLQTLLQRMLQQETTVLRSNQELRRAHSASCLVVVLSRGLFRSVQFAEMLLEVLASHGMDPLDFAVQKTSTQTSAMTSRSVRSSRSILKMATIHADSSFEFPGLDFYKDLEQNGLGFPLIGPDTGPALSRAYQHLLRRIALPLSCHGSESLIEHQVAAICDRLKLRDSASGLRTPSVTPHCLPKQRSSSWSSFNDEEAEDEEDHEIPLQSIPMAPAKRHDELSEEGFSGSDDCV